MPSFLGDIEMSANDREALDSFTILFLERHELAKQRIEKAGKDPSVVLDDLFSDVVGDLAVAMAKVGVKPLPRHGPRISKNPNNIPIINIDDEESMEAECITIEDSDSDDGDGLVSMMIKKNYIDLMKGLSPQGVLSLQMPGTSSGTGSGIEDLLDITRTRATLKQVHQKIIQHNNNNCQSKYDTGFGREDLEEETENSGDNISKQEHKQLPERLRLWVPKQVRYANNQFVPKSTGTVPINVNTLQHGGQLNGSIVNKVAAFMDSRILTLHFDCTKLGCMRKFSNLHQLEGHLMLEHGENVFVCQKCEHSFSNKDLLASHCTNSHSTESAWSCSTCPNKYRTYPQLAHHIYLQHQPGEFMCSFIGCTHRGDKRSQILMHYCEMHNQNNPQQLQEERVEEEDLVVDLDDEDEEEEEVRPRQAHDGLQDRGPLECAQCGKRFTLRFKLSQHERTIHSDSKPYKCVWPECTFRSKYRSNTLEHIKLRHLKELGKSKNMAIHPKTYMEVNDE